MEATSGGSNSEKALSNYNSVMISSCDPISQATLHLHNTTLLQVTKSLQYLQNVTALTAWAKQVWQVSQKTRV